MKFRFPAAVFLLTALLIYAGDSTDKVGSIEPRPPALLGVVPAPAPRGVRIFKVLADSAAQRTGLKTGDIILSVNAIPIDSPQGLIREIKKYSAESIVIVEYERLGQKQTVKVPLGARLGSASLIGKPAPAIRLPVYDLEKKFSSPRGTVLLIDFWATWCAPCEPVRTALEDFKRTGKNSAIQIIGITTEDAATVKAFYQNRIAQYPILLDSSNDVTLGFRVEGYPTVAVVDKKGIVRFAGFASGGGLETAIALAGKLAKE